jgi:hypothetical protein
MVHRMWIRPASLATIVMRLHVALRAVTCNGIAMLAVTREDFADVGAGAGRGWPPTFMTAAASC